MNNIYQWATEPEEILDLMMAEPLDMAVEIARLRKEINRLSRELVAQLETKPKVMVASFTVHGWSIPSMNQLYEQGHFMKRKKMADQAHTMVAVFCRDIEPITEPVHITIVARRKRLIDVDNVPAKLVIDGLKTAEVLPDDTNEYVKSVTTVCIKAVEPSVDVVLWRYEDGRYEDN